MKYLLALLPIFGCFTACREDEKVDALVGTQWIFATQNPVEEAAGPKSELFTPGTIITVTDSTLELERLSYPEELTISRYDSLAGGDTLEVAVKLSNPTPEILNIDLYRKGIFYRNRYFSKLDTSLHRISGKELAGRTYRYQAAEGASELIYFGFRETGNDDESLGPYYVERPNDWEMSNTLVIEPGQLISRFGPFAPVQLDGVFQRIAQTYASGEFGKQRRRLYRDGDGNFLVEVFDQHRKKHRLQYVTLEPVAGKLPTGLSIADLGRKLTEATITVDRSYPDVDSASVQYTQPDRLAGRVVPYAALDRLEFSFNEDGTFFLIAAGDVLRTGNWHPSPDGNWLIVEGGKPDNTLHLPILKYSNDGMAFRYPLNVTTREPRGVSLPSYASLNLLLEAKFR
ncbi:hypothetical protein [Lewinella sp. 4G2]|uniref:hypothetical protein n=1 Tax=Lewinella sp. 4G2 TaxID=1803372 RepID=UPI0007B49B09|nr:hypothetical protein [Lewinella sp. 4G2]OAV46095.1 hypothetical protein A3850_017690 [Lewinella sp. 4G2]